MTPESPGEGDTPEAVRIQAAGAGPSPDDIVAGIYVPDSQEEAEEEAAEAVEAPAPESVPDSQPESQPEQPSTLVREVLADYEEHGGAQQPPQPWSQPEDPYRAGLTHSLDTIANGVKSSAKVRESKRSTSYAKLPDGEEAEKLLKEAEKEEKQGVRDMAADIVQEVKKAVETNEADEDMEVADEIASETMTELAGDEWHVPPARGPLVVPVVTPATPAKKPSGAVDVDFTTPAGATAVAAAIAAVPLSPRTPVPAAAAGVGIETIVPIGDTLRAQGRRIVGLTTEKGFSAHPLHYSAEHLRARQVADELRASGIKAAKEAAKNVKQKSPDKPPAEFKADFATVSRAAFEGIRLARAEPSLASRLTRGAHEHPPGQLSPRSLRLLEEELNLLPEAAPAAAPALVVRPPRTPSERAVEELRQLSVGVTSPVSPVSPPEERPKAEAEAEAPKEEEEVKAESEEEKKRKERTLVALVDLLTEHRSKNVKTVRKWECKRLEGEPYADIRVISNLIARESDLLDKDLIDIVGAIPEIALAMVPELQTGQARSALMLLEFINENARLPNVDALEQTINNLWVRHALLDRFLSFDQAKDLAVIDRLIEAVQISRSTIQRHEISTIDAVLTQDLNNATLARDINLAGLQIMGKREDIAALHVISQGCSQRMVLDGVCKYIEDMGPTSLHSPEEHAIVKETVHDLLNAVLRDICAQWLHTAHSHATKDLMPSGDLDAMILKISKILHALFVYNQSPIVDEVDLAYLRYFCKPRTHGAIFGQVYANAASEKCHKLEERVEFLSRDLDDEDQAHQFDSLDAPVQQQTIRHWLFILNSFGIAEEAAAVKHCVDMAKYITSIARDLWQLGVFTPEQQKKGLGRRVRESLHLLRTCLVRFVAPMFVIRYDRVGYVHEHRVLWAYEFYMLLALQLLYATDYGLHPHNMRDEEAQILWHYVILFQETCVRGKLREEAAKVGDDVFIHSLRIASGFVAGGSAGFVYDADKLPPRNEPEDQDWAAADKRVWSVACSHVNSIVELVLERDNIHRDLKRPNWLAWAGAKPDEKSFLEQMDEMQTPVRTMYTTNINADVSVFMNLLFALHTELRFVRGCHLIHDMWHVESPIDGWRQETGGFNLLTFEQASGAMRDWHPDEFDDATTDAIDEADREREKQREAAAARRIVEQGRGPLGILGTPEPRARAEAAAAAAEPARDTSKPVDMTLLDVLDNTSYSVCRIHAWYGNILRRKWTYTKSARGKAGRKIDQPGAEELNKAERLFLDLPQRVKTRSNEFIGCTAIVNDADMMLLVAAAAHHLLSQPRQAVSKSAFEWPNPDSDTTWVPVIESKNPSSIEIRLQQMINGSAAARSAAVAENKMVPRITRALHVAAHLVNVELRMPDSLIQPNTEDLQAIRPAILSVQPLLEETLVVTRTKWEKGIRPVLQARFLLIASEEIHHETQESEELPQSRTDALFYVERLLTVTRSQWIWLPQVSTSLTNDKSRWKLEMLIDCICWMTHFGGISKTSEEHLFNLQQLNDKFRNVVADALDVLAKVAGSLRTRPSETFRSRSILCTRLACALLLGRRHFPFGTEEGIEKADHFVHDVMRALTALANESDSDSVRVAPRSAPPFTPSCFNAMLEVVPEEAEEEPEPRPEEEAEEKKRPMDIDADLAASAKVKTPVKKRSPKKQYTERKRAKRAEASGPLAAAGQRVMPARRAKKGKPLQPDTDWEPLPIENEPKPTPSKIKTPESKRRVASLKAKDRRKGIQAATLFELRSEAESYSWTSLFFALVINATSGDGKVMWDENTLIHDPNLMEHGSTTLKSHIRQSVFDPSKRRILPAAPAVAVPVEVGRIQNPVFLDYNTALQRYQKEAEERLKVPHVFVALSDKIAFKSNGDPEDAPRCYMSGLFSGRSYNPGDVITPYGGEVRDAAECHQLPRSEKTHIQSLPAECGKCLDGKAFSETYDLKELKNDAAEFHMEFMRPAQERRQFMPVRAPGYMGDLETARHYLHRAVFYGQGYMINAAASTSVNCKTEFVYPYKRRRNEADASNVPVCFIVATKHIKPFQELYRAYGSREAAEFLEIERGVYKEQEEDIEAVLNANLGFETETKQESLRKHLSQEEAKQVEEIQQKRARPPARAAARRASELTAAMAASARLTGIDEKRKFQISMFRDIVYLKRTDEYGGQGSIGLHAKQDLPASSELCYFDGRKVPPRGLTSLSPTELNRVMIFMTPGPTQTGPGCRWVLPRLPLNVAGWFNHPREGQGERANCVVGQKDHKVVTLRDIEKDEQLLIDYDKAYWARLWFGKDFDAATAEEKVELETKIARRFRKMEQQESSHVELKWQDQDLDKPAVISRDPPSAAQVESLLADQSKVEEAEDSEGELDAATMARALAEEAAAAAAEAPRAANLQQVVPIIRTPPRRGTKKSVSFNLDRM